MEYWPLERAKLNKVKSKILDSNVVIITGGGGTIGMAIAKKFQESGACVVLIDKKYNYDLLEEHNLKDSYLVNCDLTNYNQLKKEIYKIIMEFGGIDILISNAGAAFQGPIDTVENKVIQKVMI